MLMGQKSRQAVKLSSCSLFAGFYTSQLVQEFFHQQNYIVLRKHEHTSENCFIKSFVAQTGMFQMYVEIELRLVDPYNFP